MKISSEMARIRFLATSIRRLRRHDSFGWGGPRMRFKTTPLGLPLFFGGEKMPFQITAVLDRVSGYRVF